MPIDDGSAGAHFVTLVTRERDCMFDHVVHGNVSLSQAGEIVDQEWRRSSDIRKEILLDEFIVMPNHLHGIIIIKEAIGALIAGFKSAVTKRINALRSTPGLPVWQRNYYEHIIRNRDELNRVHRYILDNPSTWDEDLENPNVAPLAC